VFYSFLPFYDIPPVKDINQVSSVYHLFWGGVKALISGNIVVNKLQNMDTGATQLQGLRMKGEG
jgi:hypothetical protein